MANENDLLQNAMKICRKRSADVVKQKGLELSFIDLCAAVYFQAILDMVSGKTISELSNDKIN